MQIRVSKDFLRYFKPNWLSNLIGFAVGTLLIGGLAGHNWYTHSVVSQQISHAGGYTIATPASYETFVGAVNNNKLVSSMILVLLWGGVGLILYFIAASIWEWGRTAVEFDKGLHYVNVNSRSELIELGERLAIRLLATIIGGAAIVITINIVLPYVFMLSNAITVVNALLSIGYAMLGIIICWLTYHALLVTTRFALLRPRILGNS